MKNKMSTLKDVANLAGVSVATVSHVVNRTRHVTSETEARVRRAVAELRFTPNIAARSLAKQRGGRAEISQSISKIEKTNASALPGSRTFAESAPEDAFKFDKSSGGNLYGASTIGRLLKNVRAVAPISRVELARRLGVNRSTVTELVKPLLAAGTMSEGVLEISTKAGQNSLGRPPIGLSLQNEKTVFIGVNIGVRLTQAGAATINGENLAEETFETPVSPVAALAGIRDVIERLCTRFADRKLAVIGVSVPGPVDDERQCLLYAPHLGGSEKPGWRNVEIARELRFPVNFSSQQGAPKSVFVPVVVENDANAAAIYETVRRLGFANGAAARDFVLIRAGTGIGVGLVRDGNIYRGSRLGSGTAGEFGHMTIVAGGKQCPCGNRGCWERYASARSAVELYFGESRKNRETAASTGFVEIVARAEAGDRRAQTTLAQTGEYLGIGIGNVLTGLGVPRIVVGGRVVHGWKFIAEPLRRALSRTMVGYLTEWTVEAGEATGAGLGGAIEVAIDYELMKIAGET